MTRLPQVLLTSLLISTAAMAHAAANAPEDQKPTYQYSLKSGQLMPLLDLFLIVPVNKVKEEKKDSVVIKQPRLVCTEVEVPTEVGITPVL